MTIFQSLILGIIQGLTEFLPISSSAHLVLIPYLFNWSFPAEQVFPFDVLVQLGTLLAVLLYFWKDLVSIIQNFFRGLISKEPFKDQEARMGWYLIVATIPAAIFGMLLKDKVEAAFSSARVTALFLFVTAALLILADWLGKRTRRMEEFTWIDALWMGLFQALSIFPGISRSGSTIAGGMTRNLDRSTSARFSFLMSIPVFIGAGLVSIGDLLAVPNLAGFLPTLLIGFVAAAIVGYLSIHWLLDFVKRNKLWYFSLYCVVLAIIILTVGSIRGSSPQTTAANPVPAATFPAQVSTTRTSEFEIINVQYSGSLGWLVPAMSSCANMIKDAGLVTHEVSAGDQSLQKADVALRWGSPEVLASDAYQLGSDHLVLAVNTKNPLQSLTTSLTRQIFNGEITSWGTLHQACPDCFAKSYDPSFDDQQIILTAYNNGEDVQQLFIKNVMGNFPISISSAVVVPDSDAVAQSIFENSAAIGFLPAQSPNPDRKEVQITDLDPTLLQGPILAISKAAPQGKTLEWLGCLQQVLNPASN